MRTRLRWAKELVLRIALLVALLLPVQAMAEVPAAVVARAQGRAEGNDRGSAVVLGEALLGTVWSAQVLKLRVDSVLGHHVAEITLSGSKFHGKLDVAGFLREVRSLINSTFASVPVEEVDLVTTVPLDAGKNAIVSGDLAQPTSRIVFSVTVRRSDRPHLNAILSSDDVYWDASWRTELQDNAHSRATIISGR